METRTPSIDSLRGLAILGMVLANYLADVQTAPAWLKHAPDVGLTVTDLVAPLFIFAIGLTFRRSFEKRCQRDSLRSAIGHAVRRSLALIGIGAILSAGETLLGMNTSGVDWGVLQAIGAASLIALLVVRRSTLARAVIGLGLLASYQLILDRWMLASVLRSPHGGLFGAISWGAMLILATVLADLFYDPARHKAFSWGALLTLGVGAALAWIVPVSKNRGSSSYILLCLGLCALAFLVFHWLSQPGRLRLDWLTTWGKNPLALYLLHFLWLGLVVLPGIPAWHAAAPAWLVVLQAAALVGLLSLAAVWMENKKVFLVL